MHPGEHLIPPLFERGGDKSMLGLDGVVLPPCPLGLVTCLAELQFDGLTDGHPPLDAGLSKPTGRFDGPRRDDPQDLAPDRFIDPQSPEGDTAVGTMIERGPSAAVARDKPTDAGVADVQPTPAVPASQKTGQQAGHTPDRP